MIKALSAFFPSLGTAGNHVVEFYNKFHNAADDHDRDFVKKCDEDLNSTLIFVSTVSPMHLDICVNRVLGKGWFVLRSHIRFHRRRSKQT